MIGNFQIASAQKLMLYMWSFDSDFNLVALMNLVRITKTMYAIYQEMYTASMGSLLYCTQNSKFKIHSTKLPNIWLTNNSTCGVGSTAYQQVIQQQYVCTNDTTVLLVVIFIWKVYITNCD